MPAKLPQSCLTLCDTMDCSLPGSSVHRILQARILEWVALPSSKGSSQPRDGTCISCIDMWVLYHQHHLGSLNQVCSNIKLKRETIKERVDNKSKSRVARKNARQWSSQGWTQKLLPPLAQEGADYRPRKKAQLRERTQRSKSEGHREKYPGTSKSGSCREAARE